MHTHERWFRSLTKARQKPDKQSIQLMGVLTGGTIHALGAPGS